MALFSSCGWDDDLAGLLWYRGVGISGKPAACWPDAAGIPLAGAASEELRPRSASFLISCDTGTPCDAATRGYPAARLSAITAMRNECVERYVLTIIFSPNLNLA